MGNLLLRRFLGTISKPLWSKTLKFDDDSLIPQGADKANQALRHCLRGAQWTRALYWLCFITMVSRICLT